MNNNTLRTRKTKLNLPPIVNPNNAVGLGGTANLAVLGGNLPPSRTYDARSTSTACVVRPAVGRVARQNGPVARSTRTATVLFQLKTALLGVALATLTSTAPAQSNTTGRIGIYDSRAVAVAYAGSSFQQAKMSDLVGQQKKAKGAGDKKEIARLEGEGRAWQAQLHRQGFGTAPVDDLLAHISNELSKIQADAGVTQLISKWNQPELKKHSRAEQIDVTMKLVDAFHPNERQRSYAIEIQKKKPAKLKE